MMDFSTLQDILATGSDAGTLIFLYLIYRLEKRVFRVEVKSGVVKL